MKLSPNKIVDPNFRSEDRLRSYYSWRARGYDKATSYEIKHHHEAIQMADIQPEDRILEVACGTGRATIELANHLGSEGNLEALDLSEIMLAHAQQKAAERGLLGKVNFKIGSALNLPYPDHLFDLLYNAYMFDLLAVDRFLPVLKEFKRVLKPSGRLVLVNMSKNITRKTLYERIYSTARLFPCRPVFLENFVGEAGFSNVHRIYQQSYTSSIPLPFGTEIVTAQKPKG